MEDALLNQAEAVYTQIKHILQSFAKEQKLELREWYHDQARWLLRKKTEQGHISVEISYHSAPETLAVRGVIFQNGRWKTLAGPHYLSLKGKGRVPKKRFKALLASVIAETTKM